MNKSKLTTPILYLAFNRLDSVKKTFPEIQKAKPKQLFIACDGPRNKEEKEKTDSVRKYILKNINWKCKVKTLFRNKNLGCKYAVAGAINWFFKNVEQGIILEDDCLPDQSFFRFCQEMLEKYKNNEKIIQISGTSFFSKKRNKYSYIFSRYGNIWGWSTWRRSWKNYDVDLKNYDKFNQLKWKEKIKFFDKILKRYYFWLVKKKGINTWDYQWNITRSKVGGLSIIPSVNLIENIGFNGSGTHTTRMAKLTNRENLHFPITHPKKFEEDFRYNSLYYIKKSIPSAMKTCVRIILNFFS